MEEPHLAWTLGFCSMTGISVKRLNQIYIYFKMSLECWKLTPIGDCASEDTATPVLEFSWQNCMTIPIVYVFHCKQNTFIVFSV